MQDLSVGHLPVGKEVGPSRLFNEMTEPFRRTVVERALNWRAQGSQRAPTDLQQSITDALAGNRVTVPGFRNAGLAPIARLVDSVARIIRDDDDLAATLLREWLESQRELRALVSEHLADRGIATREVDLSSGAARFSVADNPWGDACETFSEENPVGGTEETLLMMSLATGTVNGSAIYSGNEDTAALQESLSRAYDALAQLPHDAPEWDEVIPGFLDRLAKLLKAKEEERNRAAMLDLLLEDLRANFAEFLGFFQWDFEIWKSANLVPNQELENAESMVADLEELLGQYAPIHERGTVASDELARSLQRADLLPRILETGGLLGQMFGPGDGPGPGGPEPTPLPGPVSGGNIAKGPPEPGIDGATRAGRKQISPDTPDDEPDSPVSGEVSEIPSFSPSFSPSSSIEDWLLLRLEVEELEQENDGLEQQVESLKTELHKSRSKDEGYWYTLTSQEGPERDNGSTLENVMDAVERAREKFSERLLVRLNSDSSVEGNAFKWPDKVWKALEWLATTYYDARVGTSANADLDASCRRASDMWYKTSQSKQTMGAYRDSYSTLVDGRRILLPEHIGKGIRFDPRRTIRIAFRWRPDLNKVVVGYIGQHQQTPSS